MQHEGSRVGNRRLVHHESIREDGLLASGQVSVLEYVNCVTPTLCQHPWKDVTCFTFATVLIHDGNFLLFVCLFGDTFYMIAPLFAEVRVHQTSPICLVMCTMRALFSSVCVPSK